MTIWNTQYLDHVADILAQKPIDKDARPVVFIGSSSFRLWATLAEDMRILNFLNAGMGGATIEDGLDHAARIFGGLRPAKIYTYFGENDVACDGLRPEDVFKQWQRLDAALQALCPDVSITHLSAKCGPARWLWREDIVAANALVSQGCSSSSSSRFLDVDSVLIGRNGKPLEKVFEADGIHLNREGYRAWAEVIQIADCTAT